LINLYSVFNDDNEAESTVDSPIAELIGLDSTDSDCDDSDLASDSDCDDSDVFSEPVDLSESDCSVLSDSLE
jgi:hypothetical protein